MYTLPSLNQSSSIGNESSPFGYHSCKYSTLPFTIRRTPKIFCISPSFDTFENYIFSLSLKKINSLRVFMFVRERVRTLSIAGDIPRLLHVIGVVADVSAMVFGARFFSAKSRYDQHCFSEARYDKVHLRYSIYKPT